MSRSWTPFREFKCTNGCEIFGHCPGHRMRLVFIHTSNHVIVQIDPKDDDSRAYNPKTDYLFDDDRFETMIALANGSKRYEAIE